VRPSLFGDVTERRLVVTDVSVEPVGHVFSVQVVEECCSRLKGPIGCHWITPFQGYCYVTLLYAQLRCYLVIRYKLFERSCKVWQLTQMSGHGTRGLYWPGSRSSRHRSH
jgi:hypothetical protein